MKKEIERKFLVDDVGALPVGIRGTKITQGYLSEDPSIRVRLKESASAEPKESKGYITIKVNAGAITRDEFEYEIPADDVRRLLQMCLYTLTKIRFTIPAGKHVWEIDVFTGRLAGLVLAEIELDAEDESFERPAWLGDEVSYDVHYFNQSLVRAMCAPSNAHGGK